MNKLIDLSITLNAQTPVYPGDPEVVIEPVGVIAAEGFNDCLLTTGNHAGTHIDAPSHMIEGGKNLDAYGLDQFVGRGVLVQGFDLATVKAADIQAGDIVLFDTGTAAKLREPAYYEAYPAMDAKLAEWLVGKKVKMVGFDTGSADNQDEFPIHKLLLASDILIIENLTNLDQLRGKEFRVIALPLKMDIDGAPARVIAELAA